MKLTTDLHVHTTLSPCAARDATPGAYIERAARQGITTLCFTDHYWDPLACKPMLWGSDVFDLREQIPQQSDVRVLLGCETECIGQGRIGITPQTAAKLDFVLLSTGHFRAKGLTVPSHVTTLDQLRVFMWEIMHDAIRADLGVPTALAHPFFANGFHEHNDELIAGFTDNDLHEIFSLAERYGVAVEVNGPTSVFGARNQDGWSIAFTRVLKAAHRCGCTFTAGSDAHSVQQFDHTRLERYLQYLGIGQHELLKI